MPAASSDGEAIFDPEDNLDNDFCNELVDSAKIRAAIDEPLFVLIIIRNPFLIVRNNNLPSCYINYPISLSAD